MKVAAVIKLRGRFLARRNKAALGRNYSIRKGWTLDETRLTAEVVTLDKVLDDLDRLISRNHDRFHDRRKRQ